MQIGSMVVWIWNEANFHSKNDISSRIYQTFPSEKNYHFMLVYLFWKWQRNPYEDNVDIIVAPIFSYPSTVGLAVLIYAKQLFKSDCSLLACCTAWYTDIVNPCDFAEFWKESCFFHLKLIFRADETKDMGISILNLQNSVESHCHLKLIPC